MDNKRKNQLRENLSKYYKLEDYKEALVWAEKLYSEFPDDKRNIYNLILTLHLLKKYDEIIKIFELAFEKGHWFSIYLFQQFDEVEELFQDPRYQKIKEINEERRLIEAKQSEMKLTVHTPNNYNCKKKHPLFIALHWGDSNTKEFEVYFKSVIKKDIILALPQSSQIASPNGFSWIDQTVSRNEINKAYNKIKEQYLIDEDSIVLLGASIGGQTALKFALIWDDIPNRGVIAIIPYNINVDKYSKNAGSFALSGKKAVFISGEQDESYKTSKELSSRLNKLGLESRFYSNDKGHIIPDNIDYLLNESLKFFNILES